VKIRKIKNRCHPVALQLGAFMQSTQKGIHGKKRIAKGYFNRQNHGVPNKPSPQKTPLSVRIPRAMKRKLQIAAASKGMTLADYCVELIRHGTENVELSNEDLQGIDQEEEQARKGKPSDKRRRPRKAGSAGGGVRG
jgi:predicted DNA-binding protein